MVLLEAEEDTLNAFRQAASSTSGPLLIGLSAAIAAGAAPLIWNDQWASMSVGALICAAFVGFFLLKKPLLALNVAIFLSLLPAGLRVEPAFMIISNLSVAIAVLAWGGRWLMRLETIRWNPAWLILLGYIVFGIVTLLWAPDLVEGRRKLIAYASGFILFFLLFQQVRTLRALDGVMSTLRILGWIIVYGGIFEIASGSYQPGQRLSIFDVNQNQLVMILLLLIPCFVWPILRSSGSRRWVHGVLSTIFILCAITFIVLSGSRGGALSLAALLFGLLLSRQVRPWALAGMIVLGGIVLAAPFLVETMSQRFEEQEGGSLGGRDVLWEAGILLIQDHPWSGVGFGGGPIEIPKYIAVLTGDTFLNTRRVFPSHNPFLEVGSDTGIIGILIYCAMLASALWPSLRKPHPSDDRAVRFFRVLVVIVAVAYFLSWIKSGGMEIHPTLFLLMLFLMIPELIRRQDLLEFSKQGLHRASPQGSGDWMRR